MGAQIVHRGTGEPIGPPQFTEMPVATEFDVDLLSPPLQWPESLERADDGDIGEGGVQDFFQCGTHSWQEQAGARGIRGI